MNFDKYLQALILKATHEGRSRGSCGEVTVPAHTAQVAEAGLTKSKIYVMSFLVAEPLLTLL